MNHSSNLLDIERGLQCTLNGIEAAQRGDEYAALVLSAAHNQALCAMAAVRRIIADIAYTDDIADTRAVIADSATTEDKDATKISALKRDLHTRELAAAEAMALVMAHEERIERLAAERDAAREDAERWRHALEHGFPVRNQTYKPGRVWIAFPGAAGGDTPEQAIDAARARALG